MSCCFIALQFTSYSFSYEANTTAEEQASFFLEVYGDSAQLTKTKVKNGETTYVIENESATGQAVSVTNIIKLKEAGSLKKREEEGRRGKKREEA